MLHAFFNACYALLAITLMAVLSSCSGSSNVADINSGDSVGFITLQASFPTTENKEFPRIKVRHTEADDAIFAQSIESGMVVNIGDNAYSGPTFISGTITYQLIQLGLGFRIYLVRALA